MAISKHDSSKSTRRRGALVAALVAAIGCAAAFAYTTRVSGTGSERQPSSSSEATTTTLAASSEYRTTKYPTSTSSSTSLSGTYRVIAWNDLGMHCVDGKDYSIMSILPPYNNLHAQVINASTGKQVTSGVTLTYEAMADPSGSINTTSSPKTNFWQFVQTLYGGSPKLNYGLNLGDPNISNPTPSTKPATMKFNSTQGWYEAEGIPITPYEDGMNSDGTYKKNFYPMVKVVARDASGKALATTQTVLPVSDEMSCKSCHASGSAGNAAKPPVQGWANFSSDPEKDWKKNILRLHDDKHAADPVYKAALVKLEPTTTGLAARAEAGTPTLCASCHGSNALNSPGYTLTVGTSQVKVSALTSAMHKMHARVNDPVKGSSLDSIANRDSCYLCHPGAVTKCLRGAMSEVPNLDCQSCHGNMTAVGQPTRVGWLQQPNCQACHHDSLRETTAVTDIKTGALRQVSDPRFATNADKPAAGFSLFRFSTGHGKNQCEACHGSTHAEYKAGSTWTSSHDNDMLQSKALQGYSGAIQECTVCHKTVPLTANGGPHGMHTIGQTWVKEHHDLIKTVGLPSCQYCHDTKDPTTGKFLNAYKGSPLSTVKVAKTFSIGDGKTVTLAAGTAVGCYNCHNGPKDD